MKAAFLETTGAPDVLRFGDLPQPVPKQGEVLVKIAAAALNPIDVYIRAGTVALSTCSSTLSVTTFSTP